MEWTSQIVFEPKKEGLLRFCVDYRKFNAIKILYSSPLHRMDLCINSIREGRRRYLRSLTRISDTVNSKSMKPTATKLYLHPIMAYTGSSECRLDLRTPQGRFNELLISFFQRQEVNISLSIYTISWFIWSPWKNIWRIFNRSWRCSKELWTMLYKPWSWRSSNYSVIRWTTLAI